MGTSSQLVNVMAAMAKTNNELNSFLIFYSFYFACGILFSGLYVADFTNINLPFVIITGEDTGDVDFSSWQSHGREVSVGAASYNDIRLVKLFELSFNAVIIHNICLIGIHLFAAVSKCNAFKRHQTACVRGKVLAVFNLRLVENHGADLKVLRSEERRVGKECRSRWSPY